VAARDSSDGRLVGYAVWRGGEDDAGEFAGLVEPDYRDVGLGSLLLRRVSADARSAGLSTLRVDLHDGSQETAAMLRDCGLATHWDLDYPIAHVDLVLGQERPGWRTP
jgi:GNAT superfamily N-acetyltransferase